MVKSKHILIIILMNFIVTAIPVYPQSSLQNMDKECCVRVKIQKIVGLSETGDAMIFKTNAGEFYLYIANEIGIKRMKIIKNAYKAKRSVCIAIDQENSNIVNEVYSVPE